MDKHQLEKCIRQGNVDDLREAVKANGELMSYRDFLGHTILQKSVMAKSVDVCRTLVELGVDVNEEGGRGQFALNMACSKGLVEIVKLLLSNGADPSLGRTLFAAANCNLENGLEVAKLLIAYGVDINKVFLIFDDPNNRKTALDFGFGKKEFTDLLLSHGAKSASELVN